MSRPPTTLRLETRSEAASVTVYVIGDIDRFGAPQLEAVIQGAIDNGATTVCLDLTELGFLDSTGLRVVVVTLRRLRTVQGTLRLVNTPPFVRSLLELTALQPYIDFDGT